AYIYQPGIFLTGFYQQALPFTRKGFQPFNGVFVTAMLAPHNGVHSYLIKVWGTTEYLLYFFEFVFAKTQLYGLLKCCLHVWKKFKFLTARRIFESTKLRCVF